jgi:phosphopantothenoylcysteine decarboxylase / phosphopantothenate---cysteine ligase
MRLAHRHFVIGVTGGIAAYKTCELVRRLQDEGATVQVVMTEAGTRFVSALTFQALSGRPVYTDEWSTPAASSPANGMAHIDLSREADALLIAPASADFIAQLANGQTGNLLATLCLARDVPLLVAPAMNRQMWENPATQRAIHQLRNDGIALLGPGQGAQACGETGDGRMLEPAELLEALVARFGPDAAIASRVAPNIRGVLEGKQVLITTGPTFEPIDPVRGITNRSSGKMGFAIARAAAHAGARVTLISGPVALRTPERVHRIDVITAQEMHDAVMTVLAKQSQDAFIGVAAVADWRPAAPLDSKLKKESGGGLRDIEWAENPDILASVAKHASAPFCIGFAAETGSTEDLHALLPAKRARKGVPLLVGNIGPDTFGADSNQVLLCDDDGIHPLNASSKEDIAALLVFELSKRLSS